MSLNILKKLEGAVDQTTAYILVDDLNHLVKEWSFVEWFRLDLGNLLSVNLF